MKYELVNRANADAAVVQKLLKETDGNEMLARMLASRGVRTPEEAYAFLHPDLSQLADPFLFRDMKKASHLVRDAVEHGRPICIYGDYDADGTCASAIMQLALRSLGAQPRVMIPQRTGDGYGLSDDAVAAMEDGSLLITVDCGISNTEQIDRAVMRGIDVILTDHHTCPDVLPGATCILNPKAPGETYPNTNLCGAGVALKLVEAIAGRDAAAALLDLAAVATVADVVPLMGENRAIVAMGLRKLNENPSVGLAALIRQSTKPGEQIDASTIGFKLAPAINAAGRMSSATLAFDLLSASMPPIAQVLAQTLTELNDERKRKQQTVTEQALQMLRESDMPAFILLASEEWEVGVLGPAASRLAETFQRPVVLCARVNDAFVGSGRSPGQINLYEALSSAGHLMEKYGGHREAAGITVREENLPVLREALQEYMAPRADRIAHAPAAEYDFELSLPVDAADVRRLEALEPCGMGNPQPIALVRDAQLQRKRPLGVEGRHAQFQISANGADLRGLMFGTAVEEIPDKADVLGELRVSNFGTRSGEPEMMVRTVSWESAEDSYFRQTVAALRSEQQVRDGRRYYRDKKRMGLIYSALRAAGPSGTPLSAAELFRQARARLRDLTREETAFAYAVFGQLQLITEEPDGTIRVVVNTKKCSLDDSSVYRKCGR